MYFHLFIHSCIHLFDNYTVECWEQNRPKIPFSVELISTQINKSSGKIYSVVVNDVEKKMRQGNSMIGIWGLICWGGLLILSRVPWEGCIEKLMFEEGPGTGKGAIPVGVWRRNAPG